MLVSIPDRGGVSGGRPLIPMAKSSTGSYPFLTRDYVYRVSNYGAALILLSSLTIPLHLSERWLCSDNQRRRKAVHGSRTDEYGGGK